MRLALAALAFLSGLSTVACTVTRLDGPTPPPEDEPMPLPEPEPNTPPVTNKQPLNPEPPQAATGGPHAEVVYVLMRDRKFSLWFCTGTLVANNRVVTAAHCLEPEKFIQYEVVAPLAANEPRVAASDPRIFGGHYSDVANPDIGILTLDTPIDLPAYAELTDVVARVEGGEALTGVAVVRTMEQPEAPLAMSQHLTLSSTVSYGYEHGFGTPYFSNGGDSGAGLFLVEGGAPTHKLIAVARQPEPDRDLDHFTRVGAPFLEWYAANTNGN